MNQMSVLIKRGKPRLMGHRAIENSFTSSIIGKKQRVGEESGVSGWCLREQVSETGPSD
ncbi:Isoprenyl transferase [Clarias magur]|uniref:Isoprenyl transferase n=1 Tax=Clarias magur TaxID=1594786 RepID=A0A8J4X5B2_CLAMG|nr:Isoprenyl transferase [Clarias magur]